MSLFTRSWRVLQSGWGRVNARVTFCFQNSSTVPTSSLPYNPHPTIASSSRHYFCHLFYLPSSSHFTGSAFCLSCEVSTITQTQIHTHTLSLSLDVHTVTVFSSILYTLSHSLSLAEIGDVAYIYACTRLCSLLDLWSRMSWDTECNTVL